MEAERNLSKDSESHISPIVTFFSTSVGVDLHSVIANNQQVFPHIGVFLFNKTVGVFSCEHDKVLPFLLFLSAIAWILCQRISIMESTMGYFANHAPTMYCNRAIHSKGPMAISKFNTLILVVCFHKIHQVYLVKKTPSLSCAWPTVSHSA